MTKLIEFEKVDQKQEKAKRKWADHIDGCFDCQFSPFSCKVGLELYEKWNAAWNVANWVFNTLSASDQESFRNGAEMSGGR